MPRKCDSCKHYRADNNRCKAWPVRNLGGDYVSVDLTTARDICDRESNGIFVYFEPKEPAAGGHFVQVCRHCGGISPLDAHTADPRCTSCNGRLNRTPPNSPHGESRAEFERDRLGQTGYDNAKAMKAAA